MSTSDHPESGQLTRRQLREQQSTGSTPVIGGATAVATQEPPAPPAAAPLARPARPVAVAPAPLPDAAVDLGVSPLTRRQARQQERIRTASVPVITPEIVAANGFGAVPPVSAAGQEDAPRTFADGPAPAAAEPADGAAQPAAEEAAAGQPAAEQAKGEQPAADEPWADPSDAAAVPEADVDAPRVDDRLGANVLADEQPADVESLSFDELLGRTGGGASIAAPHALILSHVPEASPLSAVTSTGEVIVTGIYNLPDGLGSQGHAIGAADGKEVDASLIDGELPAHSSPTPIAASAAISTVRGTGEIIRPPAPEKSSRLMLTLMITAGALALALVGLLVYVVATGVFN